MNTCSRALAPEKSHSIFKLNSTKIARYFEHHTFPSSGTAAINSIEQNSKMKSNFILLLK